jgi:hypothetical protein
MKIRKIEVCLKKYFQVLNRNIKIQLSQSTRSMNLLKCVIPVLAVSCIVLLVLASGCAGDRFDSAQGKNFGNTFDASAANVEAMNCFTNTFPPALTEKGTVRRFIEPLLTTGLDKDNLPLNEVTSFPTNQDPIYFFVIYDNFVEGDSVRVSWLFNGDSSKEVVGVVNKTGDDYGRFIIMLKKPDAGWSAGPQVIQVTGPGATTASLSFTVGGDKVVTKPLPCNWGSGQTTLPTTSITTLTTGQGTSCDKPGQLECNGKCILLNSDDANCGGCGYPCPQGSRCGQGKCYGVTDRNFVTCPEGEINTGPVCAPKSSTRETCSDGTKNNAETDVDCGGGISCPGCAPGKECGFGRDCASGSCVKGVCAQASGTSGTCSDGIKNNGETDVDCGGSCPACTDKSLLTDPMNCGTKGHTCGVYANAVGSCVNGQCTIACNTNYADCDNSINDGCETDLSTYDNCGKCRNSCSFYSNSVCKLEGTGYVCQSSHWGFG